MKFDILVIGQGENAISTDEPARMKKFFLHYVDNISA